MRILFLSHYFPPEVNAPATRTFEHCREWAGLGHEVHVVTGFPSHPAGRVYPGYRRSWHRSEEVEGIRVHRLWTYLAPNRGVLRRTLNYLSFVPTSVWRSLRLGRFDVILATSPHLLNTVAGWLAGTLKRTPWVYDLRDLWPDSIVAVGVLGPSRSVRLLGRLDRFLQRRAAAVVCVTRSFVDRSIRGGTDPEKVVYVPNAIYAEDWRASDATCAWRRKLGLEPEQVLVAYAGTLGLAHGLETVLEAADRLRSHRPEIRFVLAGDGAEREMLAAAAEERGLGNVLFTGQIPRAEVRELLGCADIGLVLLRDAPLFRTVLPSKMFEAMAAARPIILGVAGEARQVLEESGGGIPIPPQDGAALADAVSRLARDRDARLRMGSSGRAYVERAFDRRAWARAYLDVLEACARPRSLG